MGNPLRSIDPQAQYHVWCRGSNKGLIVFDESDCTMFRRELYRTATKFEWHIFAWCLMSNHHHVVLQAGQEQFSRGFQLLNGNHARRTNRRHGRTDHLFRHRPRARQLTTPADLVGAAAYVVRNPVAAGRVEHAAEWPWSSYRATVGIEPAPSWLRVDVLLALLGSDRAGRVAAFEREVHKGHVLVSNAEAAPPPLTPA